MLDPRERGMHRRGVRCRVGWQASAAASAGRQVLAGKERQTRNGAPGALPASGAPSSRLSSGERVLRLPWIVVLVTVLVGRTAMAFGHGASLRHSKRNIPLRHSPVGTK